MYACIYVCMYVSSRKNGRIVGRPCPCSQPLTKIMSHFRWLLVSIVNFQWILVSRISEARRKFTSAHKSGLWSQATLCSRAHVYTSTHACACFAQPSRCQNNITRLLGVTFHCKFTMELWCYALERHGGKLHTLLKPSCGATQTMFLEWCYTLDKGKTNLQARIKLAREASQRLKPYPLHSNLGWATCAALRKQECCQPRARPHMHTKTWNASAYGRD